VKGVLNTYDDTVQAINKWKPAQRYADEMLYRDDLLEYLQKEMNATAPYTYMPREKLSVRKQEAAGLCDISVGARAVGIKVKMDLAGNSDVDALIGQLVGYKSEYDDLIVVLVGTTDEKAFAYLLAQVSTIKDNRYAALQRIKVMRRDTR
jgi:hypothetical protein